MQFTGSLLRIISSVQFLGKHENSFLVHLVPVYSYHVQDVILAYRVSLMFLTLGQELIFNRPIYHLERK